MGIFGKLFQKTSEKETGHSSPPSLSADEILEQAHACKARDPEMAFKYFLEAAEMGNSEAMARVGSCYLYKGRGAPFDIEKSAYWHNKAAENGYVKSMIMTSWFYMAGVVFPENDDIAKGLLQKAIETGDEEAAARAKRELDTYEQTKFSVKSLLEIAIDMQGIPPKE